MQPKRGGGRVCVHGCRLTGKMTGAVDQVSDCASVITLVESSVITLNRVGDTSMPGLDRYTSMPGPDRYPKYARAPC